MRCAMPLVLNEGNEVIEYTVIGNHRQGIGQGPLYTDICAIRFVLKCFDECMSG